MTKRIGTALALVPLLALTLALEGCVTTAAGYFGKTAPPKAQRLVFSNGAEPDTIDPVHITGVPDARVAMALFEGLVNYHPVTLDPIQGIATHVDINANSTQITFFLRGHSNPQGQLIPDGRDYVDRGPKPDHTVPARWSNGETVTAHDFVASWRRAIAPKTAADYASLMYYVKNAEPINGSKGRLRVGGEFLKDEDGAEVVVDEEELARAKAAAHARWVAGEEEKGTIVDLATGDALKNARGEVLVSKAAFESMAALGRRAESAEWVAYTLEDLGIRALDDYTLQITMEAPTAFFIKMLCHQFFYAVPVKTIEACEARGVRWTDPEHIVVDGPFLLAEHIPYHQFRLVKNPTYWDAGMTGLDELLFLPIEDPVTGINLYKSGEVDMTQSGAIPQEFIRYLRETKDYQLSPYVSSVYYAINMTRPPFDDVRIRRALNMAVNKQGICDFRANGQIPATRFTPPNLTGYNAPEGDSYDPEQARKLLAEAGYPGGRDKNGTQLQAQILFNTQETNKQIAQLVQSNLQTNLGINVELINQEWKVYLDTTRRVPLRYHSLAQRIWLGDYVDPNTFLDLMLSNSVNNGTGWKDPEFDKMVTEANAQTDPQRRLDLLSKAEKRLLDACPVIPLYFGNAAYLKKPYVMGAAPNLLDTHPVKFYSIDTNWQPSPDRIAHQ